MKKLALLAVFAALVSGTAFAQQDMGNVSATGASYTTGVVESIDSGALTLREDSNRVVTLLIVKGTVGAENHPVGSRVRVNFHKNQSSQAVADEIQGVNGEIKAEAVVATPPATVVTATSTPMPTPAPAAPTYTTKTVVTPEPATMPEPSIEPATSLPQGASPLAAFGLIGLIALGGALALRFSS